MDAAPVAADPPKAGALARIGGIIAALILVFLTAVGIIAMLDVTDLIPCGDVGSDLSKLNDQGECFDGSGGRRRSRWPSAGRARFSRASRSC